MNLVSRVQAILTSPRTEWPIIAQERSNPQEIFVGYVLPLAAIPVVATFLGQLIFGIAIPGVGTVRPPIGSLIFGSILQYVLAVVSVGIMGWVVAFLAPHFGGQNDIVAGLKLVAYTSTVLWLVGAINLLSFLGFVLALFSLAAAIYAIYTAYLGFPTLMRNPHDKTIIYMVVVAVCWILLTLVIGAIVWGLFRAV